MENKKLVQQWWERVLALHIQDLEHDRGPLIHLEECYPLFDLQPLPALRFEVESAAQMIPVEWAALEGRYDEVGLTIHFIDEGIDTGDILSVRRIPFQPHETIEGAGHFLQEDKGELVAEKLISWLD